MILTTEEIKELTGRERRSAQARVLAHLGIPFKTRPDGTIVVLRASLIPQETKQRIPQLRLP